MKRNRLDELLDGEIESANTPADNQELQALLRADPEARQRRQELRESVGLLEQAGLIDPPAGLRRRIEAALEAAPAPVPMAAARRAPAAPAALLLRDAFGWSRRPASALAFAAGVLLVVALLALTREIETGPQQVARHDLLGVVLPPETPVVDSFASGQVSGRWRAVQTGARTLLRLELEAEQPVDVTVRPGPGAVCAGYLSPQPPAGGAEISAGGIELRGLPSGSHDILFLQQEPGPLDFDTRIAADGAALEERSFTVGRNQRR